jgi:hypothetical protein
MDDREIARHALDLQNRGRDYRLLDIPGYMAWSRRKLEEGVSDALIAHLDATGMWLLPEDVAKVTDADFDDLLEQLVADLGES